MMTKGEGLMLTTDEVYGVAIVGSGAAGYAAAVQAAWAGLSTVLFQSFEAGGQLVLSDRIKNYPGLQRSAVQLSCRSSVERIPLHGASRRPRNFPPTLLVG